METDTDTKLFCQNHSVCQKLKAENECFLESTRHRFAQILKNWKLPEETKIQIITILELILTEERPYISTNPSDNSYCNEIRIQNEFHKIQFFKASYFMECLEKSQISPIHLHRIQIFLQTKIFSNSDIKDFFDEIKSMESLYECRLCKLMAPLDASLEDISNNFYLTVRHKCKECFRQESKERYAMKRAETLAQSGASKPMVKMYLCMKCGEHNFVNFYERNKSKCKFCILQEKRGMYVPTMEENQLSASASKPYHCRDCHTEDPKNFRETYKSLCYACFLVEKREKYRNKGLTDDKPIKSKIKEYFCSDCGTEEPSRFRRGYKSQCYTCFLDSKKIANSESAVKIALRKVCCKYCEDKDSRNFREGMETVCARCEDIENQTFICKKCNMECLRSCFTEEELSKPDHDKTCNSCDPEAFGASQRKPWLCVFCGDKSGENFYPGFRSKCKVCTRNERRQRYEFKERTVKPYRCTDCGTENPSDFYLGHKSKCKKCM